MDLIVFCCFCKCRYKNLEVLNFLKVCFFFGYLLEVEEEVDVLFCYS